MNREEVALAWHSTRFRLQCAERTGSEFQSFFEQIMEKVDPTFVKVKPSGKEGDWKCDGWIPASGTCFQVYAPEGLTVSEAAAKMKEDFAGAVAAWKEEMKQWIFVWSSREKGIAAAILNSLNELKKDDLELAVELDQWGRERLWKKVAALPEPDRIDLLGVVPLLSDVTATTDHEVQVLLTYVADQPIPSLDQDLGLVELEKKMDRNDFSDGVRLLVKAAMPIVPTVEHYVSNNPDPRFSQRVAVSLGERHGELEALLGDDQNAIFGGLLDKIAGAGDPQSKERWAAVAIVAHYFELCDVFKR